MERSPNNTTEEQVKIFDVKVESERIRYLELTGLGPDSLQYAFRSSGQIWSRTGCAPVSKKLEELWRTESVTKLEK